MIERRRNLPVLAAALGLTLAFRVALPTAATADPTSTQTPRSVGDLKVIQDDVQRVTAEVGPATVGLITPLGAGSGVVVNEDGLILTAAHVIGEPGRRVGVYFPDGTVATGRTLGVHHGSTDAGMVQLVSEPGRERQWPHVELAPADTEPAVGDWVIALGHPERFDADRSTVVRLGRLIQVREGKSLRSDCTLIGGDSGGPLFNRKGQLIGIHSRIGRSMRSNYHVPLAVFRSEWDDLALGKLIIDNAGPGARPVIGIVFRQTDDGALVTGIVEGSGAAKAGLRTGDVITAVDGESTAIDGALQEFIVETTPGRAVTLTVKRGGETLKLDVEVAEAGDVLPTR